MRYLVREVNGTSALNRVILHDLHEELFADLAPQIEPDEGHWWIAWLGETPVGFAGLRSTITTGTGYLHRAGVLAAHRGHRLQARFIRAREAKARRLGFTRMVTDTTDNVHSANSLIRAGYRMFRPEWEWSLPRALYWERSL